MNPFKAFRYQRKVFYIVDIPTPEERQEWLDELRRRRVQILVRSHCCYYIDDLLMQGTEVVNLFLGRRQTMTMTTKDFWFFTMFRFSNARIMRIAIQGADIAGYLIGAAMLFFGAFPSRALYKLYRADIGLTPAQRRHIESFLQTPENELIDEDEPFSMWMGADHYTGLISYFFIP